MTVAGRVGSGTGEARDRKATATCILDMLRGNSVSDACSSPVNQRPGRRPSSMPMEKPQVTSGILINVCSKQCKFVNISESLSSSQDQYKIANIYIKFNSLLYKYLLSLYHDMQKENNVATLTEWTSREKGGLRLRVFRYQQNQVLLS